MVSYNVDAMRAAISDVYSGNSWKWRVRNMADNQVIAVYFSLMENGKLGLNRSGSSGTGSKVAPGSCTDGSGVHQLTIDEILAQG